MATGFVYCWKDRKNKWWVDRKADLAAQGGHN